MRRLGLLALFFCALSSAKELKITANMIQFEYWPHEGDTMMSCTHQIENEASQDWRVVCSDGKTKLRYTVHLWVTEYQRTNVPKLSFEILYWITEWTDPVASNGSTHWVHLKDESALYGLDLSQSVNRDLSSLKLSLRALR